MSRNAWTTPEPDDEFVPTWELVAAAIAGATTVGLAAFTWVYRWVRT